MDIDKINSTTYLQKNFDEFANLDFWQLKKILELVEQARFCPNRDENKRISDLQDEVDDLENQLEDLRDDYDRLEDKFNDLKDERNELKNRYVKLEKEYQALQNGIE